MKLFELSGIKSYKNMSGGLLMKMLDRKGVFKKILGKGQYGMAFELTNNEVLKVWAKDPAYESWIEYCVKNQSNPLVLKVHGKIHDFEMKRANTGTPTPMKFVRVELLNEITSMKDLGYDEPKASVLTRFMDTISNTMYNKLPETDEDIIKSVKLDIKLASPEFIKFIKGLSEISLALAKDGSVALDYHKSNFGLRGKQVVLLDPLSSDNEPLAIDSVLNGFWKDE